MQGAMSNGGMSSPLNSVLRKTISPWYDDNPNPLAGASWPQYLKNAMVITPPRTHTTWASGLTSGTPIVLLPKNGGAVLIPSTLMVGPANASASSPNIRIGYAGNSSFEMTNGGSHVCYFGNAGNFGTRVGYASQFTANSGGYFGFASTGAGTSLGTAETCIFRPASATIGIYNPTSTTTAQTFELYNTWTSTTSFENLRFKSTAGAAYQIGSAIGSAGGTNRAIDFGHWNSAGTWSSKLFIDNSNSRIGIGTNTPAANRWLDIVGSEATGNGVNVVVTNTSTDVYTSAIIGLRAGASSIGGNISAFTFDFANYGVTNGLNFSTATATDNIAFRTGSALLSGSGTAARLFIASGGNIGISTQAPSALFHVVGLAQTGLTAATERSEVNFDLSSTKQFAAGAITTQRAFRIQAPTYSFVGASTITTASTVSISGAPVAGTNATITNAYALNVESGETRLGGTLSHISYTANFGNGSLWVDGSGKVLGWSGTYFGWSSGSYVTSGTSAEFALYRDAANVMGQRGGTSAQSFGIYGTWTSTTSYERINVKGKSSANFEIGPENGSAGGTLRGLTIGGYPAGTATIVGWAQFRPNTSTGALEAFYLGPIADSTAVGGNARGTGAVDLQTSRSAASQVASGSSSLIVASQRATASGSGAVVFASVTSNSVVASGTNSVAFAQGDSGGASGACAVAFGNFPGYGGAFAAGSNSLAACGGRTSSAAAFGKAFGGGSYSDRYGQYTNANGYFADIGDAQQCGFVARRKTTDATPVNLMLDGSSTRLTIPSGKTMSGFLIVKGIKSDGSAKARFVRLCDITNVGGTTALDTPVEAIGTDYNPSGCTLAVTAENATDDLQINITGPAGETWRWTATFSGLEIAYGT